MVQCPECDKVFTRQSSLNRHLASKHVSTGAGNVCKECDKVFARQDILERHKKRLHTNPSLACTFCSRKFKRKDYFEKHQSLCVQRKDIAVSLETGHDRTSSHRQPNQSAAPELSVVPEWDLRAGDNRKDSSAEQRTMSTSPIFEALDFTDVFTTEVVGDESDSFDNDAPFEFADDINIEAIEQILEGLAGFDETGSIDIDRWPNKQQPLVAAPRWLNEALHELRQTYDDVCIEGVMHPYEVDIQSGLPTASTLEDGEAARSGFKLQLLPRVRCLDCPNKLYVARPGAVIDDLGIHMRNRLHRQSVNLRRSVDSQRVAKVVQSIFHAIKHQHFGQLEQALVKMSTEKMTEIEMLDIKEGITCCHILGHTISFGNVQMLTYLLHHGFSAGAADKNGRTALHLACWLGKTTMALRLIAFGARHSKEDSKGLRPLDLATREGHTETAIQVLRCPKPHKYQHPLRTSREVDETHIAFREACRGGYVEVVKALLKECQGPLKLKHLLEVALRSSPPAIVEVLLEAGASVHLVTPYLLRGLKEDIESCTCQARETDHAWNTEKFLLLQRYGLDWASVTLSSDSDMDSP